MYSDWVFSLMALGFFVWLGFLSIVLQKDRNFLKSIFPKSEERDVRKKFEENTALIASFDNKVNLLKKQLEEFQSLGLKHISRVELLRYNPYDDTGGDQSFSVAMLDTLGDGVVVTSLHARSGTRVFAKPIVKGKADRFAFSKEEEQVVNKAFK